MRIAVSKCDITPLKPVRQAGFIQQTEKISEVKDRLYASVIALENNGEVLYFLNADSIGMADSIRQRILDNVREEGRTTYLMLSCTHTHFAADPRDPDYAEQFIRQASDMLASLSFSEVKDLRYSFAREPYEGVGKSRLSRYPSAFVYLYVISLYDGDKRLANIVVHNCHPTVMDGYTPFFSSEYPGQLRSRMEREYPGEGFLFWQSAAGDISSRFTRPDQSYESMCLLAEGLFREVKKMISLPKETYPAAGFSVTEETIPIRHVFEQIDVSVMPEGISEREKETILIGQKVRQDLAKKVDTLPKEVRLTNVSLSDLNVVFCEKELFSAYLGYLSSDRSVLVCYSNGYGGYVTPPGFDELTYERFTDTWSDETKKAAAECISRLSRL